MINYFAIIKLKLSHQNMILLVHLVRKLFTFDLDNIERIYIYLWKNNNVFEIIFEVINSLKSTIPGIKDIFESLARYNDNTLLLENQTKRKTETVIFNELFDNIVKLTISNINLILERNDSIMKVMYVLVESLLTYKSILSTELKGFNFIKILNEFVILLSPDRLRQCLSNAFSDNTKEIDLSNYSFVLKFFKFIDELANNENENLKELIISSKLNIFEFVLSAKDVTCVDNDREADLK
jgi:hypothetical protein